MNTNINKSNNHCNDTVNIDKTDSKNDLPDDSILNIDDNPNTNISNKNISDNTNLTINPAYNDISIDNNINVLSLENFNTSLELKNTNLKQYTMNKQNNLIAI